MRAVDIIRKKRDGGAVSKEELEFLLGGLCCGRVADYQLSAFLMAVCLNGMTDHETLDLTSVMIATGSTVRFENIREAIVDKHSTGGVGDKTSIILAPLIASMGVHVPMISGRGLGHTGGTLDKLECIPGMRTDLSVEEFKKTVTEVGCSMIGQTAEMVPADKKMYAVRDVTATVESIPLIASSIMSKKIAEGAQGLVLDVKVGSGAFMKDRASARKLAETMVKIGNGLGVKTVAILTSMHEPLGRTVGNSLELKECLSAFRNKWSPDFKDLTLTLASWMLNVADSISEEVDIRPMTENTLKRYKDEITEFIEKGDALKKLIQMVDAQYGDPDALMNLSMLPQAMNVKEVRAPSDGYIRKLDAFNIGMASLHLGAGRNRVEDDIDPSAGVVLNRKVGDYVKEGDQIAMLHYNDDSGLKDAEELFVSSLEIGERDVVKPPVVLEAIFR